MTGLVITTFDRPNYLRLCFESLLMADLSKIDRIVIVDDNSTDAEVLQLTMNFIASLDCSTLVIRKIENLSIKDSLLTGFKNLLEHGCDTLINLDGDAIVRNDFVDVLLTLHQKYPALITTGFNCNTLNKDGSIRHKRLYSEPGATFRQSVGGINMCFSRETYFKFVKPALIQSLAHGGNWDNMACINCMAESLPVAVTVPSVVQHLGVVSSMGHGSDGEPADTAEDFKPLSLPNVTLVGVSDGAGDGSGIKGLFKAADISTQNINFGAIKLLSSWYTSGPDKIRNLGSKIEYSKFIIKELVDYIDTDFFILFQADGFILNWKSWNPEYFKYDYVGALWNFYDDNHKCGNGGFSFRSKKLHKILKEDKSIVLRNDNLINNYAEDHNICRIYRTYLENNYGIKFAPDEICEQFSIEAWSVKPPGNKYKGSFGYHGFSVDFNEAQLPYIPYLLPNPKREIF